MKPSEAIRFFGSQTELAKKLGISKQAVGRWVNEGKVPIPRQYQIHVITEGKLKVTGK